MTAKLPIFLFFGPPGVGKGTQSRLFVERLGFSCFAMGDALRAEVESDTKLGREIRDVIEAGKLVNDSLIMSVISGWLNTQAGSFGSVLDSFNRAIVLDGFPRTEKQVSGLLEAVDNSKVFELKSFIQLELDREDLATRLKKRRLIDGRSDDTDDTIDKRLDLYYSSIADVASHLQLACSMSHKVNADGSVEEVYSRLLRCILG